jgi:DNA-binding response OmpR family regulator
MKILYVENHDIFAFQVIPLFLSAHAVIRVRSLAEAREHFYAGGFDILLVDYDLDDGKGTELVRTVRLKNVSYPIIGVSAHAKGNQALLNAGANAVCGKMEFDTIGQVIEQVMSTK